MSFWANVRKIPSEFESRYVTIANTNENLSIRSWKISFSFILCGQIKLLNIDWYWLLPMFRKSFFNFKFPMWNFFLKISKHLVNCGAAICGENEECSYCGLVNGYNNYICEHQEKPPRTLNGPEADQKCVCTERFYREMTDGHCVPLICPTF